jgi:hypothetical protein
MLTYAAGGEARSGPAQVMGNPKTCSGTQVTCFPGTKVPILTQQALADDSGVWLYRAFKQHPEGRRGAYGAAAV